MNHDNADLPAQFCGGDFPSPSGFFENQGRCVSLCKQCGILFDGVGPTQTIDIGIDFPVKCFCFAATYAEWFDSVGQCIQCFSDNGSPNSGACL